MDAMCGAKRCRRQIDTRPYNLTIEDVGNLTIPYGADPTTEVRRGTRAEGYKGHEGGRGLT